MQTITSLMPHQVPAVAKMLPSRVGALFMDMGTGKTLTAIEIARIREAKWDRLFWFCPVALKTTIAQEWRRHTDLPESAIRVWDDRVSCRRLPVEARVHIIGIETLSGSQRATLAYHALVTERSFVIVDESSYIKGPSSLRTRRITALSAPCRYRLILNGTPFTQGVVDLYAQMRFLSDKILGYPSFYSFAANHLEYRTVIDPDGRERRTQQIVRSHNVAYLAAKIAPYVYQVRKAECLDLPEKLYEQRWLAMTPSQRALYEQAKQEFLDIALEDWTPNTILGLFTALQSIACGFWTRRDPTTHIQERLTCAHGRVDALTDVLARIEPSEPVIIWAKYQYAIDQIRAALQSTYGARAVAEFHGAQAESARQADLSRWQAGEARFLLATQSAGGHGLTLNRAAYAIFYADEFKYATRIQAEDRNHRIGQARRPTYITFGCLDSIDARIQAALDKKENALLAFRRQVDHYRKRDLKQQAIDLVKGL